MSLRTKVGQPGFNKRSVVVLLAGLLLLGSMARPVLASLSVKDLNVLAGALVKTQSAWSLAREESVRVARTRAAPRVRKKRLAIIEKHMNILQSRLTTIREKFRRVAKVVVFEPNKDAGGSFKLPGQTGEFECFSADQGRTGFCTQENTNQTFTW